MRAPAGGQDRPGSRCADGPRGAAPQQRRSCRERPSWPGARRKRPAAGPPASSEAAPQAAVERCWSRTSAEPPGQAPGGGTIAASSCLPLPSARLLFPVGHETPLALTWLQNARHRQLSLVGPVDAARRSGCNRPARQARRRPARKSASALLVVEARGDQDRLTLAPGRRRGVRQGTVVAMGPHARPGAPPAPARGPAPAPSIRVASLLEQLRQGLLKPHPFGDRTSVAAGSAIAGSASRTARVQRARDGEVGQHRQMMQRKRTRGQPYRPAAAPSPSAAPPSCR